MDQPLLGAPTPAASTSRSGARLRADGRSGVTGAREDPTDSSVIYRALRRLENAGIVKSDWDTEIAAGSPRRMYTITALGGDYLVDWVEDLGE